MLTNPLRDVEMSVSEEINASSSIEMSIRKQGLDIASEAGSGVSDRPGYVNMETLPGERIPERIATPETKYTPAETARMMATEHPYIHEVRAAQEGRFAEQPKQNADNAGLAMIGFMTGMAIGEGLVARGHNADLREYYRKNRNTVTTYGFH
jgi:hypothetical protein